MSLVLQYHNKRKAFHAEIARRSALVVQKEDRSYSIPNTPYRVPKFRPVKKERPPRNIEPDYWHLMWFHDLVFGRPRAVEKAQPTVEEIIRAVCTEFGVSKNDLISSRRTKDIVRPRQVVAYLAKTLTTRSYPEIARRLGNRDHSTQINSFRKVTAVMAQDSAFAERVARLAASLGGTAS